MKCRCAIAMFVYFIVMILRKVISAVHISLSILLHRPGCNLPFTVAVRLLVVASFCRESAVETLPVSEHIYS